MIGGNARISTYRLVEAGGKESYSGTPTLNGVSVYIGKTQFDKAALIDQANAQDIYDLESDEHLDILEGDKVMDEYNATFMVHSVWKDNRNDEIGTRTACILRRKYA